MATRTRAAKSRSAPVYHVALLRAVNVAGHQRVAMADLRDLLNRLGFTEARSLLASGNLVFRSRDQPTAQLERLLESEAARGLGLETDFFVRTAEQWHAIVAANPFPEEAKRDPARLLVMTLKDAPKPTAIQSLEAAITGPETLHVTSREAYLVYPAGMGHSRLTTALIEKKLGTRGTARNWNTVLKLEALARS